MRHLSEEQLVSLILERRSRHQHLAECQQCRARYEELQQVTAFLQEARAVPPVNAWSRLKERLARSRRAARDWTEPRWLPLVFGHLAVVAIALVLIIMLGSRLASSSTWEWIGRASAIGAIGPRTLVAVVFLIGGGLGVLAMMPALWWESRRRDLRDSK